tara:strand:+ start:61294 stop:61515 length:222 start_codon:yes stop_codon:yes gene_type:complete
MPIGVYTHNHTQAIAAAEWIINHNLGTNAPAVDVYIDYEGAVRKIIPQDVIVMSNTQVKVVFSSPRTGVAAVR